MPPSRYTLQPTPLSTTFATQLAPPTPSSRASPHSPDPLLSTPRSYRRPHSAYTSLTRLSPRSPRTFTAGGGSGGGGSPTASSAFEAAAAAHSSHSFGPAPASPMSPVSPAAAAARRLTDGFSPMRGTRSSLGGCGGVGLWSCGDVGV
eukprot:78711-Chlamydomonas_euryale.AAC.1